jgi:hypothetical protein
VATVRRERERQPVLAAAAVALGICLIFAVAVWLLVG